VLAGNGKGSGESILILGRGSSSPQKWAAASHIALADPWDLHIRGYSMSIYRFVGQNGHPLDPLALFNAKDQPITGAILKRGQAVIAFTAHPSGALIINGHKITYRSEDPFPYLLHEGNKGSPSPGQVTYFECLEVLLDRICNPLPEAHQKPLNASAPDPSPTPKGFFKKQVADEVLQSMLGTADAPFIRQVQRYSLEYFESFTSFLSAMKREKPSMDGFNAFVLWAVALLAEMRAVNEKLACELDGYRLLITNPEFHQHLHREKD
jgi:hypothetical protein